MVTRYGDPRTTPTVVCMGIATTLTTYTRIVTLRFSLRFLSLTCRSYVQKSQAWLPAVRSLGVRP